MADWKVLCIDHVGIAVDDLEKTKAVFEEALNIHPTSPDEVVEEQKVTVSFFKLSEAELEFLESTSPDGPIARFIERHRNGFQHVALRVDNIDNALADLKERGIRLIDEEPRYGAGGCRIAFLHPKATNGLLIELTQRMS